MAQERNKKKIKLSGVGQMVDAGVAKADGFTLCIG
jgi:hypothetical protein